MKTKLLILALALIGSLSASEIVTIAYGDNAGTGAQGSYTVPTGCFATVTSVAIVGDRSELRIYDSINNHLVSIPADSLDGSIVLTAGYKLEAIAYRSDADSLAFAQLTVSDIGQDSAHLPTNTAVIPTDASGPVNVILESSTDLINWTPALPGTYGANTASRFFRVRMEIQ